MSHRGARVKYYSENVDVVMLIIAKGWVPDRDVT